MIHEFIDPYTKRCDIFSINMEERRSIDKKMEEECGLIAGTDYFWRGDDMVVISGKGVDRMNSLWFKCIKELNWKKLPKQKTLFGKNLFY